MADYRLTQSGDEVQRILNTATPVSSLEEESERAQNAEQQLQTNIDSEATNRQQADNTLQQHIDAEAARAEDAEGVLDGKIDAETQDRQDAVAAEVQARREAVAAEASARQDADTTLQQHIDAERTARIADVNEEETRAKSAENLLQQNIANESTARQQAVANEADARASAVATEAQARQQADTTLQGNISAEALTRQQADATLQTNINSEETRAEAAEQALGTRVTTVEGKIPSDASPQNKLVTEQFVNSTTATATATYRGSYNEVSDLHLATTATRVEIAAELGSVISVADNNDYAFVQIPTSDETPTEIARVERYKFNGTAWAFEFALNNSGFTADQWEAINSAITSELVAKLLALPTNAELIALLNGKQAVIADLDTIRSGAQAGAMSAPQATTYTKTDVNELVGNEETRARGAESTLQQNINAESTARQQADTTLQGNIDDEETRAKAAEKANADDIDAIEAKIPSAASELNKLVDTASLNQQMSGKQNVIDDLADIRSGAAAGATAYQKPQGGIPETDLTAALQTSLASFITASTQNLVYYYLKSETYSAAQVDQMLAAIKQFRYEAVQTLPEASAQTVGKIYLVPSADPKTQNTKDEYITLTTTEESTTTYSWECIGSTTIDLSNYYTKTQTDAAITAVLNAALADYSTTSQIGTMISTAINTALAQYYNKTQVDNIANTKTDKLTMTGEGAAVEDDIMVIDENGNIKDGGKKISDLQLKVTDCAMLGGGFPTCTTAGGTPAKTVSIPHFLLLPNCRISVLFQNAFTATNPTLSINSGAAIAIRHFGRAMEIGKVHANTILTMIYDGTYWQVVGIEGITGSTPSGAVDLALPSGLLWCEHNVGAASPYDDGLYFSWGNVTGHTGTDGYDFGTSNDGPYAGTPGAALTGDIPAGNDYDAARHNMGTPWRMPTQPEFQELADNCDSVWTDEDGVAGRRFTSRINGNSIFFPASGYRYGTSLYGRGTNGYYWSSTLYSSAYGYYLYFNSGGVYPANNGNRCYGFSVRAVQ